jgi:exopolysaccharide production protein ExoY
MPDPRVSEEYEPRVEQDERIGDEGGLRSPARGEQDAATLAANGTRNGVVVVAHIPVPGPRLGYRYHGWRRHLKRGLDLTAVIVALPLVLPVMASLALGVTLSSPGNPFFLQERVGHKGQRFRCIKFRTMYPDAEDRLNSDADLYAYYVANDFKLPIDRDPRVFPFGRLLRRTSLDELPQIVNVLVGDMSLVGPRPVVPAELPCYGQWEPAYLALRPGMTGRWQTDGRNNIRYPERAELDAEYLATWRLSSDIRILARTIPALFRHRHL